MRGQLFVISAPSGTGKTTMLGRVMTEIPALEFSVSHTTRAPRGAEQDGVDYHFVEKSFFEAQIEQGFFLEWAQVHGNFYGTSFSAIQDKLEKGIDVILDIDVQGARQVKSSSFSHSVQIFIAPPSMEELERRLRSRGTEGEDAVLTRLANARTEMQASADYPYLIINDTLEQAVLMLKGVILAARSGNHRDFNNNSINLNVAS